VVSGLLWFGAPREVLDAARGGRLHLLTSTELLVELEDILQRPKFAQRLALAGTSAHELVLGYAALATLVKPAAIEPVIISDPDDDAVLACAVAAQAEVVVSGDSHLLDLEQFQNILILRAAELIARITP
jgi:putative PIN family toxin of toxin-antitoxin system